MSKCNPLQDQPNVEQGPKKTTAWNTRLDPKKPMLFVPSSFTQISESAEQNFAELAKARRMFIQDTTIVELAPSADGKTEIVPVTPSGLRSRIEEVGNIVAWRSGANGEAVVKPTVLSEDGAKALHASKAARQLLPRISKVFACPIATEGEAGELAILGPGYHSNDGGIVITSGNVTKDVPLDLARRSLVDLIEGFDFCSDGDSMRASASMIAPGLLFGGLLRGRAPLDLGTAYELNSGKTLRQQVVAAIYNDIPYPINRKKGGVGGLEESIGQALLSGRPCIQLDNLRGALDSEYLETILTALRIAVRVPYRAEVLVDPRHHYFFATSNGFEPTEDLKSRCAEVKHRPRPFDYRFKTYPEGGIVAHVQANQSFYLGCVFTIIGAWLEAGRPVTEEMRHRFREWAQSLDWIVRNLLKGIAPLLDDSNAPSILGLGSDIFLKG